MSGLGGEGEEGEAEHQRPAECRRACHVFHHGHAGPLRLNGPTCPIPTDAMRCGDFLTRSSMRLQFRVSSGAFWFAPLSVIFFVACCLFQG